MICSNSANLDESQSGTKPYGSADLKVLLSHEMCVCVYAYAYIPAHAYMCVCACVYVCIRICVEMCMCTCGSRYRHSEKYQRIPLISKPHLSYLMISSHLYHHTKLIFTKLSSVPRAALYSGNSSQAPPQSKSISFWRLSTNHFGRG